MTEGLEDRTAIRNNRLKTEVVYCQVMKDGDDVKVWLFDKLGIPKWGRALIVILTAVIFGSFSLAAYFFYSTNAKADKQGQKMSELSDKVTGALAVQDKKLTSIGDAIRALAAVTPSKDLVNEMLRNVRDEERRQRDKEITPIKQQIKLLDDKLAVAVNERKDLHDQLDRQLAIARIDTPARVLNIIQEELRIAQANRRQLPTAQLADYRNAVLGLPSNSNQYWSTLAAIVNYQSFLNQLLGKAPNPAAVSRQCPTTGGQNNLYTNSEYQGCIVDLDTQAFQNVVFIDSVIRYRGGSASLRNVTFRNCLFQLTVPPNTPAQPQQKILVDLLVQSPNPTITLGM